MKKLIKVVSVFLAVNLLVDLFLPTAALALTGGPSQPEVESFTPVGTSDMVDHFTGDLTYNIPLLDVDGYPLNLSYRSGITMDQEASWVGLGWNVNAGAITRNMRGLPDDFKGDMVKKDFNIKNNNTYGVSYGVGGELGGSELLSGSIGYSVSYNNYNGIGIEQLLNLGLSSSDKAKGHMTGGLGLNITSGPDGLGVSPSANIGKKSDGAEKKGSVSVGTSFNSRTGLKQLTMGASYSQKGKGGGKTTSAGSSKSSSISFANPSYIPQVDLPFKNISFAFSAKLGPTVMTADVTTDIGGYYSGQRLEFNSMEVPAYGYLYSHDGSAQDKALLDFNREKDGSYNINTPALPLTNFTYDIYSVAGQGVSGMFRPFRGDLGQVFDSRVSSTSESFNGGVEIGGGGILKGGADVMHNDVYTTSGKWKNNNLAAAALKFKKTTNDPSYEPFYFKEAGEKNLDSDPLYAAMGASHPVRIGLSVSGNETVATANFALGGFSATNLPMPVSSLGNRTTRKKRNQLFSILNRGDYAHAVQPGLSSQIHNSNGHHTAQVTITKTDGNRYVYGLPAYNTKHKEVTFATGSPQDTATGLVNYAGTDNSPKNTNGHDNYYNSMELPPYAHSYMLTAVLSPDYVDLTGNGPSADDFGTYTKFEYAKYLNYNWRVPYLANKANFNEGLKSLAHDDKANYLYGEKELFFLSRVETKNHIAVFTVKDRADGWGVAGENGGQGTSATKLLKKISLYAKTDPAVPLKEVHFEYDYSLCKAVHNNLANAVLDPECEQSNEGGKLTLKKVYFTYGNSKKAKLSPYQFFYADLNHNGDEDLEDIKANPDYNMKAYDRWGNYKPNDNSTIPNSEFPYVEQNKVNADIYSAAWHLTKLKLPSGGLINIFYESDDYAYVQDKQAMQMFKITGVGTDSSNHLANNDLTKDSKLFFKLQEPVLVNPGLDNYYLSRYLKGIDKVYFRALININAPAGVRDEYISGYADKNSFGFASTTIAGPGNSQYYTHGYIQLKDICIGDGTDCGLSAVNPISKAAWQFARMHTPREAFNNQDEPSPDLGFEQVILALADADVFTNAFAALLGPNLTLKLKPLGERLQIGKSWIRMNNPTLKKYGGGNRVKKITVSDEWGEMVNNNTQTFLYGQNYDYTMIDPETNMVISSGVAEYEPLIGGDENPFKVPVSFFNTKPDLLLAPDNDLYMEEPFGESFFPSPSVGYSKIKVSNLPRHENNDPTQPLIVKRNATGHVIYEFYTAKDFPVSTSRTVLDAKPFKTSPLGQILKLDVKDYMTVSQGYVIELNDMHGKQKAQWNFAENVGHQLSGVEYFYKADGKRLRNDVTVLNKNGSLGQVSLGIDFDFISDMREQETSSETVGYQGQLYGVFIPPIPGPVPVPFILPAFSKERTRFRSAVVTKVINRYGLLQETVAHESGSKVATQNLAYDSETGEVILTSYRNSYKDLQYKLSYPVHLAYDRMGPAYRNTGVTLSSIVDPAGQIINPSALSLLVPGDELRISGSSERYWVKKSSNGLYIIKTDGQIATGLSGSQFTVIRSGRRNQQSLTVGTVVSRKNPFDADGNNVIDSTFSPITPSLGIINASSNEFSEVWKTFCECNGTLNEAYNPYVLGTLGNWRMLKSWVPLSLRSQTNNNENTNARQDGQLTAFTPFWSTNGSNDWAKPSNLTTPAATWLWNSEVTEYSPYGFELENKDVLNRYSAALYGYNYALPTAVSLNARYKQTGFDSFEDYDFGTCDERHFDFRKNYKLSINNREAHTGRKSITVGPEQEITLEKILESCEYQPR